MLQTDMVDFAGQVLRRRLKRVLEAGDDIGGLDAPALHAVRLDGKKLRYAAEMLAPLYDRKDAQPLPAQADRTAGIPRQAERRRGGGDADGGAGSGAKPGAERAFAAGVVRGFVAAKGGAARKEIGSAWKKFRRLEPFWYR